MPSGPVGAQVCAPERLAAQTRSPATGPSAPAATTWSRWLAGDAGGTTLGGAEQDVAASAPVSHLTVVLRMTGPSLPRIVNEGHQGRKRGERNGARTDRHRRGRPGPRR